METNYTICPVCGSPDLHYQLTASDHTASAREFEIWQCDHCSLRFTQRAPDSDSIAAYYKSDDYISHTETKRGFISSLYHSVRKITLDNKRRMILSLTGLRTGRLLDVGAGTGSFVSFMKDYGWNATGLEPDQGARQKAQIVYQVQLQEPGNIYLFPDESFDVITMWHVLEHVHELHDCLNQLKKLIKPQGKIFIAVPNYTSFDASFYKKYWAAYDVPRHLYHFSPRSLKKLFNEHGFELQSTRSMPFDSFYISLLSERYQKNKLGLLRGFLVGFYSNLIAFVNKERCSSLVYIINK